MKFWMFALMGIVIAGIVTAQPGLEWVRAYDGSGSFGDVYATTEGNYASCTSSWVFADHHDEGDHHWHGLFKLYVCDPNGDVITNVQFGEIEGRNAAFSLIEVDGGGFLLGGAYQDRFYAVRCDRNGEQIWANPYGDIEGVCSTVIELKSGEFLLAGYTRGENEEYSGYLIKLDGDGEVLWDRQYHSTEDRTGFSSMREVDECVVLTGGHDSTAGWLLKVSQNNGEPIWERFYGQDIQNRWSGLSHVIHLRNGGFQMCGRAEFDRGIRHWLIQVDENGEVVWDRYLNPGNQRSLSCVVEMPAGGTTAFGTTNNNQVGIMIRINQGGEEIWTQEMADIGQGVTCNGISEAVLTEDGGLIMAGRGNVLRERGGMLIKGIPEVSPPQIIARFPDLDNNPAPSDTTILVGDSLFFNVTAVDLQNDRLLYTWRLNGEDVGADTCYGHRFEERDDFLVTCTVSDGAQADSTYWIVHAKDFYIDHFYPDSTDFVIRRGSSVDFTHHVRSIEYFEFEYRWEHFGRGGNYEIQGEDSIRFDFDLTGEHIIRAVVSTEDEIETVSWDVNVRSIIWWWWPHELAISVPVDTTMEFVVFPFNEESDSLQFSWSLNGEDLDINEATLNIPFPEEGMNTITAILIEGQEADTVWWEVAVRERVFTADFADLADLPSELALYPPSPNPFNSTTTIRYALPHASVVSLNLYNLSGKRIETLTNRGQQAGLHQVTLNACNRPSGLYFVKLEGSGQVFTRKIMLVK